MGPTDLFKAAFAAGNAGEAAAAGETLVEAWFASARAREIADVAAAARVAFGYNVWAGHPRLDVPLDPSRITDFSPSARLPLAALLSLHRSGYVRELALAFLAASPDARVVPYLLLRADDIVPKLRDLAESALIERLRPALAAQFARSLALVEVLGGRLRSGSGAIVKTIRDYLAEPVHRQALADASRDEDPVVRRAAFVLRLRVEPAEPVLREALFDTDSRVRWIAARTVVSRATSVAEKAVLLPLLERARAPAIRRLALRGWQAVEEADARIEAALLDHDASVRYLARATLRERQPDRPFGKTREQALALLDAPAASANALVGALGALSDVGLRSDVDEVKKLLEHPRAAVRAEARRTLEWLTR